LRKVAAVAVAEAVLMRAERQPSPAMAVRARQVQQTQRAERFLAAAGADQIRALLAPVLRAKRSSFAGNGLKYGINIPGVRMIGSFIAILFLCREIAHREHLKTRNDAAHRALQAFYEEIVDLADDLAELYQGRNGIIAEIPFMPPIFKATPADTLAAYLEWIEANRYEAVPKTDTAIQNHIDEVVAIYLRTLYRLRNLS